MADKSFNVGDRVKWMNGGSEANITPGLEALKRIAPRATIFRTPAEVQTRIEGSLKDKGLHADIQTAVGSTQGALTGSIYSEVAVVLVEMCVLTNPSDEAFMASDSGQAKMAQALAAATRAALPAIPRRVKT